MLLGEAVAQKRGPSGSPGLMESWPYVQDAFNRLVSYSSIRLGAQTADCGERNRTPKCRSWTPGEMVVRVRDSVIGLVGPLPLLYHA